jgi:hypothetical protein
LTGVGIEISFHQQPTTRKEKEDMFFRANKVEVNIQSNVEGGRGYFFVFATELSTPCAFGSYDDEWSRNWLGVDENCPLLSEEWTI